MKSSQKQIDDVSPFGTFALQGTQKLLLSLLRHSVLGRGTFRPWFIRNAGFLTAGPIDEHVRGFRGRFYAGDNSCEKKSLISPSSYAKIEFAAIDQLMTSDFTFIDIGANVGLYSLYTAQIGRTDTKIISLEPHPILHRRLCFNVKINEFSQIRTRELAVGDREGTAILSCDEKHMGGGSLVVVQEQAATVEVPVKPLLTIVKEEGLDHIDLIKIDIEGYEDRALLPFFKDAPKKLWPRFAIVEYIGRDQWQSDCLTVMADLGYREQFRTKNNVGLVLS